MRRINSEIQLMLTWAFSFEITEILDVVRRSSIKLSKDHMVAGSSNLWQSSISGFGWSTE